MSHFKQLNLIKLDQIKSDTIRSDLILIRPNLNRFC